MTVKELKEKLANIPDNARVFVDYKYNCGLYESGNYDVEETDHAQKTYFVEILNHFHLSTF